MLSLPQQTKLRKKKCYSRFNDIKRKPEKLLTIFRNNREVISILLPQADSDIYQNYKTRSEQN